MRHGFLVLGIGAALLGWSAWRVLPPDAAPARAPAGQAASVAPLPSGGLDRAAAAAIVLARPLFAPTRRPAEDAPGAIAAPASLPRLSGVMLSSADRSAIFVAAEGGRPIVAQEGAQVGAYRVQSIAAGRVVLMGPDGAHMLRPGFAPRGSVTPMLAGTAR